MITTLNEFRLILEIGEASIVPYEFIAHRDPDFPKTTLKGYFTTEKGVKYTVTGLLKPEFLDTYELYVAFDTNFDPMEPEIETNHNDQYKVMSTVIAIIKKFLEIAPEVNEISFSAKQKEKYQVTNTNQRMLMYKQYVQKNFPDWKIVPSGFSNKIYLKKPYNTL